MRTLVLSTVALVMAVFIMACDEDQDITYVNNTSQTVTIVTSGGVVEAKIKPFRSEKVNTIAFQTPRLIEAKNEAGEIVFSETLTWNQVKDRDWTIVISQCTSSLGR